ncbi:hypothetical protein EJ110_NYTH08047 [Nymphaea thermarum]|nr:hypothetical protein EJ110_NYTH08047 [Nymphaea thermarum]
MVNFTKAAFDSIDPAAFSQQINPKLASCIASLDGHFPAAGSRISCSFLEDKASCIASLDGHFPAAGSRISCSFLEDKAFLTSFANPEPGFAVSNCKMMTPTA